MHDNKTCGEDADDSEVPSVMSIGFFFAGKIVALSLRKCPVKPLRDLLGRRVENLRSADIRRY